MAGPAGGISLQHDFGQSLAKSKAQEDAPWWPRVYRAAFPDLVAMPSVREDGWAQRGGIDRVLTLSSGKTITVDEKVRYKDYGDVLLEFWSVWRGQYPDGKGEKRGWVAQDLSCDFIAYAIVPTQRCVLMPFQTLRRAWRKNYREWVDLGRREARGYYISVAPNRDYQTISACVPEEDLLSALRDAMVVTWEETRTAA
jgi:hypothetical protein